MARSSAKKAKKADSETHESVPEVSTSGADEWAKAVVDGVPADDGVDATTGSTPGNDTEQTADMPPEDLDAEILDAEIIDLEDIDSDAPDPDDAPAEDAAGTDAEPVEEADVAMATTDDTEERTETTEQAESAAQDVSDAAATPTDPDGGEASAEAAPDGGQDGNATDISVEDLVLGLERVTAERDQYLDASRRLQAEFENYKKQVGKREAEARERANDSLVGELLPVLDAFDGAVANGAEDVVPMRTSFLDALAKQGLERIDPSDDAFDPNLHEAVMHEDADDTDGPVVAEVMRAGYVWKGRVLRPAMVRTRG